MRINLNQLVVQSFLDVNWHSSTWQLVRGQNSSSAICDSSHNWYIKGGKCSIFVSYRKMTSGWCSFISIPNSLLLRFRPLTFHYTIVAAIMVWFVWPGGPFQTFIFLLPLLLMMLLRQRLCPSSSCPPSGVEFWHVLGGVLTALNPDHFKSIFVGLETR